MAALLCKVDGGKAPPGSNSDENTIFQRLGIPKVILIKQAQSQVKSSPGPIRKSSKGLQNEMTILTQLKPSKIGKIKKFITAVFGDFAEIFVGIEVPQAIADGQTIRLAICGNGK